MENNGKIDAFTSATPTPGSVADFQLKMPEIAVQIKCCERAMQIEMCSAGDDEEKIQKLREKYSKRLEELAQSILDADALQNGKLHKKSRAPLLEMTPQIKRTVYKYSAKLLNVGAIRKCKDQQVCLDCGKPITSGQIYVHMLDGSSECVHVDCCGKGLFLMEDTEFCMVE